jgi:hypothetical protein
MVRKPFVLLFAIATLSSCSTAVTELVPADHKDPELHWIMPSAGSKFRIDTKDSGSSIATNTDIDIFTIIQSNQSWMGRDSVFLYGWSKTFRQYHVTFEPNGDTGIETDSGIDIYPTGAKGRKIFPTLTGTDGSHIKTVYRENMGWEKITLADVMYDAIRIGGHSVEVEIASDSTVANKKTMDQTWWFIPALGFAGKTERNIVTEKAGSNTSTFRSLTLGEILK